MTLKFIKNLFLKHVLSAFKPADGHSKELFKPEPLIQSVKQRNPVHTISWGSVDVRLRKPYR